MRATNSRIDSAVGNNFPYRKLNEIVLDRIINRPYSYFKDFGVHY